VLNVGDLRDVSKSLSSAKASMVSTNKSGDRGLPWRSPLAWQMHLPRVSFSRIFVLAVERGIEIQLFHHLEKPRS
jgi:hypothetical protein